MGYQGGAGAYGGGGYGMYGGGYPTMGYSPMSATPPQPQVPAGGGVTAASTAAPGTDLTGSYLGSSGAPHLRMPRVVPNFFDNTLLIQGTPQEWEQISKLLRQLDVPPRQVLIEAKIYEVSLTGQFASGVQAALQKTGTSNGNGESQSPLAAVSRIFQASTTGATLVMSAGMLVGQSRELLAALAAQESNGRAKIISAPSLITTDSIPAKINVGQEVPTLSSQAVAGGVQQEGSSLFTNTITNRSSGVTLQILARVNSSGIVTMMLDQEVSVPVPPPAGAAIQSPSFTKRNVQTQVTVQDGDMIAIGGIIQESETLSSAGVPVLHRIPVIGVMFGSKLYSKERTELLVFLTPRVIYDTNQVRDATEEMTSKLKRLQKLIKE
jgi:general secretion pathway protein D